MFIPIATITQQGQATIPVEIRRELGVHPGDKIAFELVDGQVLLRKLEPFDVAYHEALAGTLSEWDSEEDDEAYDDL